MPKSETELALAGGVTVKTFGSQEDHSIVLTNDGRITATGLVAFTGCTVDGSDAKTKAVAVDPATGVITSQESSAANVYVYAKTVVGNTQIKNAKGVTYNSSGWLNLGKLVSQAQLPLVEGTRIDPRSELFSAAVAELDTKQLPSSVRTRTLILTRFRGMICSAKEATTTAMRARPAMMETTAGAQAIISTVHFLPTA